MKKDPKKLIIKRNGKTYTWPKEIKWSKGPPTVTTQTEVK